MTTGKIVGVNGNMITVAFDGAAVIDRHIIHSLSGRAEACGAGDDVVERAAGRAGRGECETRSAQARAEGRRTGPRLEAAPDGHRLFRDSQVREAGQT